MCLAYSGSRGAVFSTAILLMITLFGIIRTARAKIALQTVIGFVIGSGLLIAVAIAVFSDGITSFLLRWDAAYASESRYFAGGIIGRALYGFVDFARLMFESPILGYGLGSGGNASTILGGSIRGLAPNELAETDWSRHILDLGPVFGVAFIAYRVMLVAWLTRQVLRSKAIVAYALYAVVVHEILLGQITGNGVVNGFAWLFLGLCLAAAKVESSAQPLSITAAQPRFANVLK